MKTILQLEAIATVIVADITALGGYFTVSGQRFASENRELIEQLIELEVQPGEEIKRPESNTP